MQKNNPVVRKKVKFVPKASINIERMISIKPKEEEVKYLDAKKMHYKSNNIVLAKDRTRRQIKPPQRCACGNLIAST